MKKEGLYLLFIIILTPIVFSAKITGTVYDLSLDKVNNAIVFVDSSPQQRIVATDGIYSFNLPIGNYEIKVDSTIDGTYYSAKENVEIIDDGEYTLDLFLYPDLIENDELYDDSNIDIPEINIEKKKNNSINLLISLVFLIVIMIYFMTHKKKKKSKEKKPESYPADSPLDDDLQEIIYLLQKNGGRMTQKEIRKSFALSEAKISMMITELIHLEQVKKIKKGRGNIIVLR
ncbi:hypothetical protein HOD20_06045 [archaeon]|jgi:uncharacterized membrane protein|nr:hypothetical protein [archaeon]MBT4352065.1 hypothetical protein [archaeon]MBT4647176.1 hypothetical protein [archaeon]MBT6822179.1 hypothetical protein [archaeon]MBT7391746.1 hypothetical protein [archaeon]